ncbi:MAG: methanogenesis marker 14 protein, partial [ANME-2 cluster archaeon]|nr:methanogenesis marker 14 protein [ANME-2 cluster archaeon]
FLIDEYYFINQQIQLIQRSRFVGHYPIFGWGTVCLDRGGKSKEAAVMARCINSLGTPPNPLWECCDEKCIIGRRIKLQGR